VHDFLLKHSRKKKKRELEPMKGRKRRKRRSLERKRTEVAGRKKKTIYLRESRGGSSDFERPLKN